MDRDDYRRHFETIAENATLALFIMDEQQRCTYMNPAAERLTGFALAELQGKALHYHVHHTRPDGTPYPIEECPIDRAFPRNMREQGTETFVHRDGHFYPVAFTASPIREAGRTVGTIIEVREISEELAREEERSRLLAELVVERSRLKAVFAQTPSVLAMVRGPQHVLVMANDAYIALNGHRDVIGKPLLDAIPELRGQGFELLLDRVVATGEPYLGREVPILLSTSPDAEPEERFFDFVYLPLVELDEHGTEVRVGVIAHGTDITSQVRSRREVERLLGVSERARGDAEAARIAVEDQRRLLELILDGLPIGVVVVDATGAVVHVNPACDKVLGASLKPVAQLPDYAIYGGGLHPNGRPYAPEDYPIARAVMHGEVVQQELTRYRRGDGSVVTVSISAAPVRDAEGRITHAVAAVEDVSALESARAAAESANRAKSEFLATMSHELRTPLNAIGGYAELVELGIHGPVTEAQRSALGRIQASQRHLLGLIAGVLDYSRVEAGAVTYRMRDVPVAEAVAEAEALVAPQLRNKGLGYRWSGAPPGLAVHADREKLQQILLNLLGNAIKFTDPRQGEPGRIEVECEVVSRIDGDLVRLHVHDTGEGVPADQLERIFEPFVQADQRLTRPHEGVGLGLAISRDLARGMGGELTARSEAGVGSTFTLMLKRCRPARHES